MLNNKNELLEKLFKYRNIFNDKIYKYLEGLIELEYSCIKRYLDASDLEVLSNLELYREIARYNIYNRTLSIFKGSNLPLEINENVVGNLQVYVNNEEDDIKLFEFIYHDGPINLKTINKKIENIGTISLFKTTLKEEEEQRELVELVSSMCDYDEAKKLIIPDKNLTESETYEKKITETFNKKILEDYGLTDSDFLEDSSSLFTNFEDGKTEWQKVMIKKFPNLTIKNYIKYL